MTKQELSLVWVFNVQYLKGIFLYLKYIVIGVCLSVLHIIDVVFASDRITRFEIPSDSSNLVGSLSYIKVSSADTFSDLANQYGIGFDALKYANPQVDPWLPKDGDTVVIPRLYILPDAPHEGIIINIPEKKLYYFPVISGQQKTIVEIYAVSVGRQEWNTPITKTQVTGKLKDPVWYPPKSLRDEHFANGEIYPKVVPPGASNPLGQYLLQLDIPSYFIHGTNNRFGIGMQVTRGCIRMYPEDIESIYRRIEKGVPVSIINKTYKIAWKDNVIYLEINSVPEINKQQTIEEIELFPSDREAVQELIKVRMGMKDQSLELELDWDMIEKIRTETTGIPVAIGYFHKPLHADIP